MPLLIDRDLLTFRGCPLIDAIYSPVLKVHYDVEAARVGQRTDYERLV